MDLWSERVKLWRAIVVKWAINIKSDFLFVVDWLIELYYGGEAFTADQPQSFTCPYCGKMGFTETALQEHVASEHSDASIEVVSI